MKKAILIVLAIAVMSAGCTPVPIFAPIGACVALDRHLCKKKGIKPPQVNPTLKKLFEKGDKPEK